MAKEPIRIVRDISWLSFNERVLQEAADKSVHPHDRLKFLGIFSNNMDEFFRVRVATLQRMAKVEKVGRIYFEKNPEKILIRIQNIVMDLRKTFDEIYENLLREMAASGIHMITEDSLQAKEKKWVRNYFNETVRTHLAPLMLKSLPKAPPLQDGLIYLACVFQKTKTKADYSLIEIPTNQLGRFIRLPESKSGEERIILLEDVIRFCLPELASQFGYKSFKSYLIKMTRDAELGIDEDLDGDIIKALEKGLKKRKLGKALRFVFDREIDKDLLAFLVEMFGLGKGDHFIPGGRIHNFKDFMDFPSEVFPKRRRQNKPFVHKLLEQPVRLMDVLDKRDVMLHLPYHSFDSIIDLLREAAIDPDAKSILISCYRLAKNSKIINALISAARNGKKVTVVLELRARFNEAENLKWKGLLEEEGIQVLIGQRHMKVHSKMGMISRTKNGVTNYYSFVSSGNLHEQTAKFYTDHYLLTSNKDIAFDIQRVFQFIAAPKTWKSLELCEHLIVSPHNTRNHFLECLDGEIKRAKKGHFIIKLNSLADEALINKILEAIDCGVKVELIIRGIYRLKTNSNSSNLNLSAISIVDEYLEHGRVMYFHNGGAPKMYISSADWMRRNLDHRVEVTVPIYDKKIQKELKTILDMQLADNVKSRTLTNKLKNKYKITEAGEKKFRSQKEIYNFLVNQ